MASGAPGTAAERSPRSNAGLATRQRSGRKWVPGHTKAGLAKIQRQAAQRAAHQGARFRTFTDRILGALPVLSYRGAADPTVARYAGGWVAVSTGPGAPRALAPQPGGPWQNIPSALTVQPSWAISGRYWASDLVVGQRSVAALLLRRGGRPRPGRALHRRRHGHRPDGGLRPRREAAGLPQAGGRPAGVRQDQAARPRHAQGRRHRPRLLQGQGRAPVPALPHPGHAVLDPHGRAAAQRPPGGQRAQRPSWCAAAA